MFGGCPRHALLVLFVVALALRLGACLILRDVNDGLHNAIGADPVEFNTLALSVAHGEGFALAGRPTSFRAPGWPFVLAGVYRIVGENYAAVYLLLCLLSAAACLLSYAIARELGFGRWSIWAGWLCAFYLPHIYFATQFDSETFFTTIFALGIWLMLRHLRSGSPAELAVAGVVLGYAALTRPFALLLLPGLLLVMLWRGGPMRHRLAVGVVFVLSFLVPLAPWTVRNTLVHGRVVLVATNGGSTFYGANNDAVLESWQRWGGWVSTTQLPGREWIMAQPDEVSHDAAEWRLGLAWCRTNWEKLPVLAVLKVTRLWLPDIASMNRRYIAMQLLCYTPYLLLCIFGGFALVRRRDLRTRAWFAVHVCMLATVATAIIFWGSPRFRDANAPILMAYALLGVQLVLTWGKGGAAHAGGVAQRRGGVAKGT